MTKTKSLMGVLERNFGGMIVSHIGSDNEDTY